MTFITGEPKRFRYSVGAGALAVWDLEALRATWFIEEVEIEDSDTAVVWAPFAHGHQAVDLAVRCAGHDVQAVGSMSQSYGAEIDEPLQGVLMVGGPWVEFVAVREDLVRRLEVSGTVETWPALGPDRLIFRGPPLEAVSVIAEVVATADLPLVSGSVVGVSPVVNRAISLARVGRAQLREPDYSIAPGSAGVAHLTLSDEAAHGPPEVITRLISELRSLDGVHKVVREDRELILVVTDVPMRMIAAVADRCL